MRNLILEFKNENIYDVEGDLLALKYTKDNYGLSEEVLVAQETKDRSVNTFDTTFYKKPNCIRCSSLLFVNLPETSDLKFEDIRRFSEIVVEIVEENNVSNCLMTIHGTNNLDEEKSFASQVQGIINAISNKKRINHLKKILFVEKNQDTFRRIIDYMDNINTSYKQYIKKTHTYSYLIHKDIPHGFSLLSEDKGHIFVAMPFDKAFNNVFNYGIETAIKNNGYITSRIDKEKIRGEIVEEIRNKINTAKAIVADLTGKNPSVSFEVGFALAKEKTIILVSQCADDVIFELKGRQCLPYENDDIKFLENDLTEKIRVLVK